jgi:hypothetical protein
VAGLGKVRNDMAGTRSDSMAFEATSLAFGASTECDRKHHKVPCPRSLRTLAESRQPLLDRSKLPHKAKR